VIDPPGNRDDRLTWAVMGLSLAGLTHFTWGRGRIGTASHGQVSEGIDGAGDRLRVGLAGWWRGGRWAGTSLVNTTTKAAQSELSARSAGGPNGFRTGPHVRDPPARNGGGAARRRVLPGHSSGAECSTERRAG